jgi:hypothetical protein
MTTPDSPKKVEPQETGGFPIQAKLLLAVLAVAVIALILKATGVF